MKKSLSILLFFTFLLFKICVSTEQVSDVLVYNGKKYFVYTHPDLKLAGHNLETSSSACWRGYSASFLIKNDSLFLTNVSTCFSFDSANFDWTEINNQTPLFLKEFSGNIYNDNCMLGYREKNKGIIVKNGIVNHKSLNSISCANMVLKKYWPYIIGIPLGIFLLLQLNKL